MTPCGNLEPLFWESSTYHIWSGIAARSDPTDPYPGVKFFIHPSPTNGPNFFVLRKNSCPFDLTGLGLEHAKHLCEQERSLNQFQFPPVGVVHLDDLRTKRLQQTQDIRSAGHQRVLAYRKEQASIIAAQKINANLQKLNEKGLAISLALSENGLSTNGLAESDQVISQRPSPAVRTLVGPLWNRLQTLKQRSQQMATLTKTASKPVAKPAAPVATKPGPAKSPPAPAVAVPRGKAVVTPAAVANAQEAAIAVGTEAKSNPAPKKDRVSLSEEEVAAAVEGTLQEREIKGTPDQPALTELDESGKAKGRPIGITTGLPILGAWCYIFQHNEIAAPEEKFTDEQISAWMKEEFPGRQTPAFDHPASCRNDFNNGKFTKNIMPKYESVRYAEGGEVWVKPTKPEKATPASTNPDGTPAEALADPGTNGTPEGQTSAVVKAAPLRPKPATTKSEQIAQRQAAPTPTPPKPAPVAAKKTLVKK